MEKKRCEIEIKLEIEIDSNKKMFPLRPARILQISKRSITYLNVGSRIRGMKRDPSTYMKNATGLDYKTVQGESAYQDKVREAFNFKSYDIDLPNDVILQCLTHKSFAHGSLPYNEKLQLLGSQFLKLRAAVYSLGNTSQNQNVGQSLESAQFNVNGCNFNNLGSQHSKQMVSRKTISDMVRRNNLQDLVFWKMRDPVKPGAYNGEDRVFSTVIHSLVGALLITNGPEKTARFVDGYFFRG